MRLGLMEVVSDFKRDDFHTYVPGDYPDSQRESMDEVYRMGEIVLLHKTTGLRLEYLTTESYYGDEVRYRFRSIFIVTKSGEKRDVLDVDFESEQIATPEGLVPFSNLKMDSRGD